MQKVQRGSIVTMSGFTKEKLYITFSIVISIVLLDQFTKSIIEHSLFLNQVIEIIPNFFNIVYIKNPGAAFGMFGDAGIYRVFFLVGVSLFAVCIITYLIAQSDGTPSVIGLAMIGGGAIGNLIDRAKFGEVTDFLDFYVAGYHWPAFNVADSAITVGVALMCVIYYYEGKAEAQDKETSN